MDANLDDVRSRFVDGQPSQLLLCKSPLSIEWIKSWSTAFPKMGPKPNGESESSSSGDVMPLQEWLKAFNSRGVDMRLAMTLASKM